MAKIVPSKEAPQEEILFGFASGEFTLDAGGSYDTDDRSLIGEAEAHPWLAVEYDSSERAEPQFRDVGVDPKKDVLVAANSEAFDPEAVERDRVAVLGDDVTPVAIDSGLKQETRKTVAGTAVTFAADPTRDKENGS